VNLYVTMPSACDAGSGVWECLLSETDCVNLLWVDFCLKFGKGLSVWTVALGYSLSPGLSGLWTLLGPCSLRGSSILKENLCLKTLVLGQ